jgi:hypothetical protein
VQRDRATIEDRDPRACRRCVIVSFQLLAFGELPDLSRNDGDQRPPTVIANPHDDDRFRILIDRFLASGRRGPEELQATLRVRYPSAVVRPRALAGERFEVWYAYRDGHWIGAENDDQT